MDGNYDFEECIGLKVKPRSGDGLLFYSLLPNGTIDPVSLASLWPRFQLIDKFIGWLRNLLVFIMLHKLNYI